MTFELLIKEGAQADITESFQQYSRINSYLGDDFLLRLDEAFERILSGPEMFAKVFREIRQMRTRRFPYVVSYLIEGDRVIVLAVSHGHRNPNVWKDRA